MIGNMALIAQEVQVYASSHWSEFLALLPAASRQRINETDPGCMERYTEECWDAVVILGDSSDPLNVQEDMRIGGGLVAFLLAFPLVGLCLAKRRLHRATILQKTESALAAVTLLCGICSAQYVQPLSVSLSLCLAVSLSLCAIVDTDRSRYKPAGSLRLLLLRHSPAALLDRRLGGGGARSAGHSTAVEQLHTLHGSGRGPGPQ